MKEYLIYILQNIVDAPEKINVRELAGEATVIYEISAAKSDIGKIIGRQGKTIGAIRTLLHVIASRNNMRIELSIIG